MLLIAGCCGDEDEKDGEGGKLADADDEAKEVVKEDDEEDVIPLLLILPISVVPMSLLL